MIIPIELRFKADKDSKSAFRTDKTIKSHDVNSVEFHISLDGLELTGSHTAKILSVFHSSKRQVNVGCEIVEGKIIYKPDTNLISRREHVTNYVYVYHNDQSLDVREFIYTVDLSKIDETPLEVKEVYDQSYADLLADFEQALEDYKLTLPQADSVRADIDEILNQFSEDSQQVIGDLGEVSATVEIAEASRVEKESERVQAETERIQAEQARKEAELLREESYEQKVDTAIVEADVVEKVDNKVTELTPMMNDLTAQLAQTGNKTNNFILLSDYADNTGQTIVDGEVQSAFNYAIDNALSIRVDGTFKLTQPLTIPDNSIPSLIGDGVEQSKLIFDIDGDDYALTVQTYHTRPLQIKDLTIRADRNTQTVKQNAMKVDFGSWGGSIQIENVFITNFTGVLYHVVDTFNCFQHNLQLYGANVDPYVATLLKITKTSGIFSNLSEFVGCGFQYGKIAIQNLGGANYSFQRCQFEHLNLFLHTPLVTDPDVSNRMYFSNNWFEQVAKGIINADMNEDTLEPINPISNRSNLNFLYFDSNYDGGRTPNTMLSSEIEPEASKNFTLSAGNRTVLIKFNGWQDVPLTSGWSGTIKTFRRTDGLVVLIANGITPDTIPSNTTVATLPFRSEGAVAISAINGDSAVINSNAFWLNGDKLFKPASANYGNAPHSFSIMYYERQ